MDGWRDDPGARRGLAGAERRPEKSPAAVKKTPAGEKMAPARPRRADRVKAMMPTFLTREVRL